MGDKEALPRRDGPEAAPPADATPHGGAALGGTVARLGKMAQDAMSPRGRMSLREHLGEL